MSETLFEQVASDLAEKGYCVLTDALPKGLAKALAETAKTQAKSFKTAGVGRGVGHTQDKQVRSDSIAWIDGRNSAEQEWIDFLEALKQYINRSLFLGLFSVESHFAHYEPGAFYEKHSDAFRGQSNRILSLVTYLNSDWQTEWGGELLIYDSSGNDVLERVLPELGTLVIFLSEEFPHEVLPATQDRFSIASWYRLNTSGSQRVDPPK